MESVFITLFVRGGPAWGEVESWAWTMYCSFRMSWGRGGQVSRWDWRAFGEGGVPRLG